MLSFLYKQIFKKKKKKCAFASFRKQGMSMGKNILALPDIQWKEFVM